MGCGSDESCVGGCKDEQNNVKINNTVVAAMPRNCSKCSENKAQIRATNQTEFLCRDCLHANLLSKFKTSVNLNAMILPSDKVLLAFSGGPSSRVVLEFVRELRSKAQRDADASRDNILQVFDVGVAFVDESTVAHGSQTCQLIEEIKLLLSGNVQPKEKIHVAALECLWSENEESCKQTLLDLLARIHDTTSKEDLLGYLRMQVLQKIAIENGYSKLLLGLNASRIAVHVLSSTVKGQGYSLPADVRYIDARWEVPVVLPLRDCASKELTMLCHFNSWKSISISSTSILGAPNSINALVGAFVSSMQDENPSREQTIVRTAEKLKAFTFNKLPENTAVSHLSRRRQEVLKNNTRSEASIELLCPVCSSPLNERDFDFKTSPQSIENFKELYISRSRGEKSECSTSSLFMSMCCPTCRFQILDDQKESNIHLLLPNLMRERAHENAFDRDSWIRKNIEDCLLSDEDGD